MPYDSVTELQNNFNNLVEYMYTAIGIIQRDSANVGEKEVVAFAQNLIETSRTIDSLIDSLPGASLTKDEQLESINNLNQENEQLAIELRQKVLDAGVCFHIFCERFFFFLFIWFVSSLNRISLTQHGRGIVFNIKRQIETVTTRIDTTTMMTTISSSFLCYIIHTHTRTTP
jgi:hypothetical protein